MSVTLASIARFLCGLVDSVIYIVISKMYELFKDVAGIILYSQSMFDTLGQRIGLILGIFMLFRLAVALITYLISPDKLTDNSKGGAKMLTNIIFSLTLLVTVNMIFIQAYKVQKTVIDSNFIEKIFFGKKAQLPNINIGYTLYSSFLTPNIEGCETLLDPYTKIDPTCEQELNKITNTNINESLNNLLKNYELNKVFSNYDLLNYRINNDWLFSYLPILSTVAGGAVVLVLISFCMELATRAVKLLFLQLIAPVPIIANMDPAKGSEIFKKWYKECINTYLSIFIRVIGINFAIFMITLIKTEFANIFTGRSILLTALLVIGCLMFAKRVPKLLEDMLGIKFDGMSLKPLKKFQEQALFGKNITSLGAAGLAGVAAFGTNAYARGRGAIKSFGTEGFKAGMGDLAYGLGSSVAGGISGIRRGIGNAFKGQDFKQTYKGAYNDAMTARTNRDDRKELEIRPWEVWKENAYSSMHIANEAKAKESKLKNLDEYVSAGTAAKQRAEGEVDKKADMIKYNGQSLGAMRDAYEMLKNAQPDIKDSRAAININDIAAQTSRNAGETDQQFEDRIREIWQKKVNEHFQHSAEEMAKAASDAHSKYFKARKAITNAYIENGGDLDHNSIVKRDARGNIIQNIEGFHDAFTGAYRDEIVESNINKMETLNKAHEMNQPVNRADIGKSIQHADDARNAIRGSDEYGKSQLIQQQAQKEKK